MITNEDLLKEISEQELKELSDLNANGIFNFHSKLDADEALKKRKKEVEGKNITSG